MKFLNFGENSEDHDDNHDEHMDDSSSCHDCENDIVTQIWIKLFDGP